MKTLQLEKLADYCAEVKLEDIPPEVIQKAKICLLDVLECASSANADARVGSAYRSVQKRRRDNGAAIWGEPGCYEASDAGFVNAVKASVSYRNDLHRTSAIHAGAIVCAAALAVAECEKVVPERILLGIILGYEGMVRLGEILTMAGLPKGIRCTAVCAPFGAALAAASTLGLPSRDICSALSFSCHGSVGNNEWARAGTGEDAYQAGWGVRCGIQAVELACAGGIGCASSLEGDHGFLAGLNVLNAEYLGKGLGKEFRILFVEHKPIEACLMLQAPCQAAYKIAKMYDYNPECIQKISLFLSGQALHQPGCDSDQVSNVVQAKMNLRYGVCRIMAYKPLDWKVPDKITEKLMSKTELIEDGFYTKHFPVQTGCRILLQTKTGCMEYGLPDFVPLTEEQVRMLFVKNVQLWLGKERMEHIYDMVMGLEQLKSIKELSDHLREPFEVNT